MILFSSVPTSAIYGYNPSHNYSERPLLDNIVYHIKPKEASTKCLDVLNAYTADGSEVWLYDMNINAACQEWRFFWIEGTGNDAVYKIQDCNSGKYLSVKDDSPDNYATIEIRSYTGGSGQQFKIIMNSDNTFRIMTKSSNYQKTIYYLYDYTGGGIDYYRLDQYYYLPNDDTCRWYIENASNDRYDYGVGVPDGNYLISLESTKQVVYYDANSLSAIKLDLYENLDEHPMMTFVYQGKGYYQIKRGNKYLSGNSSTANNMSVSWSSSYTGADTQLWEITYLEDENIFKLRSKNLVTANKSYYLEKGGLFQNYNLCQGSTYTSRWNLIVDEVYKADTYFIGIIDSSHPSHSSWMGDAARHCYDGGQNSCTFAYQSEFSSANDIGDSITELESKIVIIRGHGSQDGITTQMLLYDQGVDNSNDQPVITGNSVANCDFSKVEIILYIGCHTASGFDMPGHSTLLNKSVDYADCLIAVGFIDEIGCGTANTMAEQFMNYYFYNLSDCDNYDELTESQKLDIRISSYISAIKKSASDAQLQQKCIYYYAGEYNSCN